MDSLTTAVPPVPTAGAVPPAPTFTQRGFSLTEMAVVLVIVALLIGGMVLPMSAQRDIRDMTETQRLLADAGEALYGYAASHTASDGRPHLPCPDTDGDGRENRAGNSCTAREGDLPWSDLGIRHQDAWGRLLRYRVSATFTDNKIGFQLLSPGDLRICGNAACTTVIATSVPAVILSLGKNGGITPVDADQQENTDMDNDFVQRMPGGDESGFDDIVAWLPTSILINRMIVAGHLP